jgi:flagellar hook assembly protein FlgD
VTNRSGSGGSIAVTWDGRTNAGAIVADGTYRLTLTATDNAANRVSRAWNVRLDRTPASVATSVTPALFSPNGDGVVETARLAWSSNEAITGSARIYKGTTLIRSWSISNARSGALTWNGTTAAGAAVADGSYTFRVTGRDAAGNAVTKNATVVVDRTLSTVRWSRAAFYPHDGDALLPNAKATFTLKRAARVSVGIYSGATLVRTVWTNRSLAAGSYGWTWDGRNAAGAFVPRGTYSVRVTAVSPYGTSVVGRTVLVDAFRTALSATSLAAGQTLTLTMTSTEALRASPIVSLTQPGRTARQATATSLGGGRWRVQFTIASGTPGTATIQINGRDTANGLNVSTTKVAIR